MARALFVEINQPKACEDFVAAAAWTRAVPGGNVKLGAVGFCCSGGVANFLATRVPELLAAAPFYGPPAPADAEGRIKAALKAAGVRFAAHTDPGTQRGFNNDTSPRYYAAAAAKAWSRTLALFNRALR